MEVQLANGVLCGPVPMVTSGNNRGIVRSGVLCGFVKRLYLET
jgi:hypothetical protein